MIQHKTILFICIKVVYTVHKQISIMIEIKQKSQKRLFLILLFFFSFFFWEKSAQSLSIRSAAESTKAFF
jgi:hypothetical protein